MYEERGIRNVSCFFPTIVQICDCLWGEMAIGNKSETTDVEKNCITSLVIFDDYFFVFIRIFCDGVVVSVEEVLQEVLFGVCGIYFSRCPIFVFNLVPGVH